MTKIHFKKKHSHIIPMSRWITKNITNIEHTKKKQKQIIPPSKDGTL